MVMVNQIIHLGVGVENSQMLYCLLFWDLPAIDEFNSFIAGHRMEEPLQQEEQESEYKDPKEDQG